MLDNEPVLDISKKPLIATYPMPKKLMAALYIS